MVYDVYLSEIASQLDFCPALEKRCHCKKKEELLLKVTSTLEFYKITSAQINHLYYYLINTAIFHKTMLFFIMLL